MRNADGKDVAKQGNRVVELGGTHGFRRLPGPLPAVEFREFAQRPFGEFGPALLQRRQRVLPVFSSIQFQPGILFNPPQVGRGGEAEGQTGVVGLLLLRLVLAVFFLEAAKQASRHREGGSFQQLPNFLASPVEPRIIAARLVAQQILLPGFSQTFSLVASAFTLHRRK